MQFEFACMLPGHCMRRRCIERAQQEALHHHIWRWSWRLCNNRHWVSLRRLKRIRRKSRGSLINSCFCCPIIIFLHAELLVWKFSDGFLVRTGARLIRYSSETIGLLGQLMQMLTTRNYAQGYEQRAYESQTARVFTLMCKVAKV
jgi:hypothetical protein